MPHTVRNQRARSTEDVNCRAYITLYELTREAVQPRKEQEGGRVVKLMKRKRNN